MDVTTVLIALIFGFMVVTIFSLTALFIVRKREKSRQSIDSERISKAIEDLDAAVDSAIKEINKLGALVQNEIDEKYKSTLFLYNLVEEKQKEIAESSDSEVIAEMVAQYVKVHSEKLKQMTEASVAEVMQVAATAKATQKIIHRVEPESIVAEVESEPSPPEIIKPKTPPKFSNSKHKQIWEMRESGKTPTAIAKELNMGQGEVKLILDLLDRSVS